MKNFSTSILIFSLALVGPVVKAQTNVNGFISQNTTWDLAGSPYIVIGNTLLSQGYTLTIDPGVTVKFNANCALQIDGTLIAIGNALNRIIFTSNQTVPAPGDWASIHFGDSAANAVFDSNGNYLSGSVLKFCTVIYGGSTPFGCIQIGSSSPYVNHCLISNSASYGIYSNGSAFRLDSSVVQHCAEFGLWFYNTFVNSCGLAVISDTLQFNRGGILINGVPGCTTVIRDNYFHANSKYGSIKAHNSISDLYITGNVFYGDSATEIGYGIMCLDQFGTAANHVISNNQFIENHKSDFGYLFREGLSVGYDSITNNLFRGNTVTNSSDGLFLARNYNTGITHSVISNNCFEDNTITTAYGSMVEVGNISSQSPVYFSNNTIRNNTTPSNKPLCDFSIYLGTATPLMFINDNDISGNSSQASISIAGNNMPGTGYTPLYMKRNNLTNPASAFELYNTILFGSPNLYPDSNYWGSTSAQHIDSVIYDYFDQSAFSIVYYSSPLSSPLLIDQHCSGTTADLGDIFFNDDPDQAVFPNPVSENATIRFGRMIDNGTVNIYNMFGQCVRANPLHAVKEINFERRNLSPGMYFYSVTENLFNRCKGKFVIE